MSEQQPYSQEQKLSPQELVAQRVTQLEQQSANIEEQILALMEQQKEIKDLMGTAGQVLAFLNRQETVLELEQAGIIPAGTYDQQKAQANLFLAQEKVETIIEPIILEPEEKKQEDPQPPTTDSATKTITLKGNSENESIAAMSALANLKNQGIDEPLSTTNLAEIIANDPTNEELVQKIRKERLTSPVLINLIAQKANETGVELLRKFPTPKLKHSELEWSLSEEPELRTVEYTEEKVGDDIHATFVGFADEKKPEDLKKKA